MVGRWRSEKKPNNSAHPRRESRRQTPAVPTQTSSEFPLSLAGKNKKKERLRKTKEEKKMKKKENRWTSSTAFFASGLVETVARPLVLFLAYTSLHPIPASSSPHCCNPQQFKAPSCSNSRRQLLPLTSLPSAATTRLITHTHITSGHSLPPPHRHNPTSDRSSSLAQILGGRK